MYDILAKGSDLIALVTREELEESDLRYDTLGRNEALSSWDLDNASIGVLLELYFFHFSNFHLGNASIILIYENELRVS